MLLETLGNIEEYKKKRAAAWERNAKYWLQEPLRHVVDTGDLIVSRIVRHLKESKLQCPVIVDMGFGDGWVLKKLAAKKTKFKYIGLDSNDEFIESAKKSFQKLEFCEFVKCDIEKKLATNIKADIVLNAFNFFELSNLKQGISNAQRMLSKNGILIVATIDVTYLIYAVSQSFKQFKVNLKRYEQLPGIKYAFQKIDLGTRLSNYLEYPSVMYSLKNYLDSAKGMSLTFYEEMVKTAKPIPKIYQIFELNVNE